MPRKKAVPPAETLAAEMVPPAPEAAPETPSAAQPQALEASPVPPALPQAESSLMPEPGPSAPPVIPEEETAAPEDMPETEASPSIALEDPPDFVDPGDGESPAEPEAAPVPEGRPAIVTAAKGLNLREGPGFGFEVLTVLESGTLVLILGLPMGVKVPGWVLAGTGEMTGWVSDKHLRALVD
ncbi:SH3 domain-containing protein [uncultured Oscillibacter sp.]|uniref:SH3 domain-containing protein n=1 Tax=uncultured Oscillibacter sp. TaxID=876091 RepID=UPI00261DADBB|nr:SH3 domain-containing protein [uncultured Oscillibacter sp.]